jgi:hypothetical protein
MGRSAASCASHVASVQSTHPRSPKIARVTIDVAFKPHLGRTQIWESPAGRGPYLWTRCGRNGSRHAGAPLTGLPAFRICVTLRTDHGPSMRSAAREVALNDLPSLAPNAQNGSSSRSGPPTAPSISTSVEVRCAQRSGRSAPELRPGGRQVRVIENLEVRTRFTVGEPQQQVRLCTFHGRVGNESSGRCCTGGSDVEVEPPSA